MAEILLAFEDVELRNGADSSTLIFGGGSPVTVDEIKSISIVEKRTEQLITFPHDARVYQLIMEYTFGSSEVHIRVKTMTTTDVTGVVDHDSLNVTLLRENALPMIALPIFTKNQEVTYKVFMPSFGASEGQALELFSKRQSIKQGQKVSNQSLKNDSASMEFTTAAKVITSELIDQYDIIVAYERT